MSLSESHCTHTYKFGHSYMHNRDEGLNPPVQQHDHLKTGFSNERNSLTLVPPGDSPADCVPCRWRRAVVASWAVPARSVWAVLRRPAAEAAGPVSGGPPWSGAPVETKRTVHISHSAE